MIRIYNTATSSKQKLTPRKGKKINLFVCGPTVYDYAHIGHARTYVFFDCFVKYLRSKDYNVFYLQNITDIDDKIIKRATEQKKSPFIVAENFEREYLRDMESLKIDGVTRYAKATANIEGIISQVERLIKKKYAYFIENDGIYYDISKFKRYGKLSKRTAVQAEDGVSRIDENIKKRNKGDFCLWKFSTKNPKKINPFEPKWRSPWGEGRPGWHIEDTAISEKYFGAQYDIHGGGKDLMFPHHEAEIAQMEAISKKKPFVKYWMHTGFLTVDGEKMSKSLGNFITIRDFFKKHSPRILRFIVLKSHYRSPINYNKDTVEQAVQELKKIDEFLCKINNLRKDDKKNKDIAKLIKATETKIEKSLDDDFNTPLAIASLFKFITKINSNLSKDKVTSADLEEIMQFLERVDLIFHFIVASKEEMLIKEVSINKELSKMLKERELFREKKEWDNADKIKRQIEKLGYLVEDTKDGPKLKKK